jgi:microcystin-dependent protein
MTTFVPQSLLAEDYPTAAEVVALANIICPIGTVIEYAGTAEPAVVQGVTWVFPYGQAVSRTTYATLFARLGTAHGVGDGTTTFNLPDRRGRVAVGQDDMGGTSANRITAAVAGFDGDVLGATGGDERLHGHVHAVTVTDPGHVHGLDVRGGTGAGTAMEDADATGAAPTVNTSSSTTGITAAATSTGGGSSQNVQPSIVQNFLIRVL